MTNPLIGPDGKVPAAARLLPDVSDAITKLAEKLDKSTAELVGELAMEGLECRRMHRIAQSGKKK